MYAFISKNWKRTVFRHPCQVVDLSFGHGLFNHHDAFFLQPVNHVECLVLVFPALVGVDGDGQVGDGAYGLNHLLVLVRTHFDFQYLEHVRTFTRLFLDHIRRVDADGERGVGCFFRVKTPYFVPWQSPHFPYEVVERDVDSRLCGGVALIHPVDVGQDVLKLCGVLEISDDFLYFCEKFAYGVRRAKFFGKIGRHGSLSVAGNAIVFYFHLDIGCRAASVGGNREHMTEFQFVRGETQFHSCGSIMSEVYRRKFVFIFTCGSNRNPGYTHQGVFQKSTSRNSHVQYALEI